MPNHIHGIIILDGNHEKTAEKGHALSLQYPQSLWSTNDGSIGQQRFQNIGKNSISSIVGSYKSAVTKHAHRLGFDFAWQPLFYDHIIRNEESYKRIQSYIINNPSRWQKDKFYN